MSDENLILLGFSVITALYYFRSFKHMKAYQWERLVFLIASALYALSLVGRIYFGNEISAPLYIVATIAAVIGFSRLRKFQSRNQN